MNASDYIPDQVHVILTTDFEENIPINGCEGDYLKVKDLVSRGSILLWLTR
jgi:hypothetical protein